MITDGGSMSMSHIMATILRAKWDAVRDGQPLTEYRVTEAELRELWLEAPGPHGEESWQRHVACAQTVGLRAVGLRIYLKEEGQ